MLRVLSPWALCLLLLLPWSTPNALAQDTESRFEGWKDRVVQIQVMDLAAGSKAGIGSGFFAGRPGWIVSNYHVIAELVNNPGHYEARYLADSGEEGRLTLLAVDAVHDLALLVTDGLERPPLGMAGALPARGARLWSMGYPFDIGLTIVEGTFNGKLQRSRLDKLHFTGSINPGMSGGPTLDEHGQVVGVNVATAGNQVSFLVPVHKVMDLLAEAPEDPGSPEHLNAMVASQLLKNQGAIAASTLEQPLPTTRLGEYQVPAGLGDFVNCWGNSENDEENRLDLVYYACYSQDNIFLSSLFETGIIQYQHDVVSTEALAPLRFYRQLENRSYYPRLQLNGDEHTVSNFQCQSGFVDQEGLPMKVTYCVRHYRKHDGLFDAYLSATSLVGDQQALQSTLVLAGFNWYNLQRFSARFLEAFSWDP